MDWPWRRAGHTGTERRPEGARVPKRSGVEPTGNSFAAGALQVMEFFQTERDEALHERDEARRAARRILDCLENESLGRLKVSLESVVEDAEAEYPWLKEMREEMDAMRPSGWGPRNRGVQAQHNREVASPKGDGEA